MYCSDDAWLFQPQPATGTPRSGNFKPHGWNTLEGYKVEAHRLSTAILCNGRKLVWHAAINFPLLTVQQIKSTWRTVSQKLRRHGVIALWVREPDRSNHCNYHLLVAQPTNEDDLRTALSGIDALAGVSKIRSSSAIARYVCKSGDRYNPLLFAEKLNKFGAIGDFWKVPKKQLWKQIIDTERTISARIDGDVALRRTAAYLSHLVCGAVSIRQIARNLSRWGVADDLADDARNWYFERAASDA